MKIEATSFVPLLSENLSSLSRSCVPFWHPLCFVSCVIEVKHGEYTVRVHYWPKGARRVKNPDWPVHTHAYFLSSLVLSGTLRDLQYRTYKGNANTIYEVRYYDGDSEIVRTKQSVNLETVIDEVRGPGEHYCVNQGIFHQTEVLVESSAVTLVAISNFCDLQPKVLESTGQKKYPYKRIPFDRGRFWTEVRRSLCVN